MKKAVFIVGITSVGKTALAVYLSEKIPSVLISADSVQVYKGADIISGKDHPKGTKLYLVDLVSPQENFSVKDFQDMARPIIEQAFRDLKIPIIVGGTGFYIESLLRSIETLDIPPNKKLRKSLETLTVIELQEKLKEINPVRFEKMNNSDVNNKRRLIRAIETAQVQGRTLGINEPVLKEEDVLLVGLRASKEDLRKRIEIRTQERIKMGALLEAQMLFDNYKNLSSQIKSAAGYKQLFDFLENRTTFEEAIEKWVIAEMQLAKKQTTWFKRMDDIVWFDAEKPRLKESILRLITHELGL